METISAIVMFAVVLVIVGVALDAARRRSTLALARGQVNIG